MRAQDGRTSCCSLMHIAHTSLTAFNATTTMLDVLCISLAHVSFCSIPDSQSYHVPFIKFRVRLNFF